MLDPLIAPDHMLSIRFSGMLTLEDVQKFQQFFVDRLGKYEQINACIDLTALFDMKADALFGGMKADMEWLSYIDQIDRFVMVSDKEWPHAVIDIVALMLLPDSEIKVFKPKDRDEALQCAATNSNLIKTGKPAL